MKRFAVALGVLSAFATGPAHADTITDWNQTTGAVMKAANVGGNPASRTLAMVHVAMSDAVNSVQGRYTAYLAPRPSLAGGSAEAAASAAARQILTQLYPNQKTIIDEAYAASIKAIADAGGKSDEVALGEQIAAAVHADRASDGTNAPDTYRPFTSPGVWVPTTPPLFAQYAQAKPWILTGADQFRPGPPPALTSALYTRDYNETREVGGSKSATRTPAQTDAVKFWTQANITSSWQQAARQLSAAKGLGLADNARLFALLNIGLANTFITDWDAKFTYNFWRPITAIRNADKDENEATQRDGSQAGLRRSSLLCHPKSRGGYSSEAGYMYLIIRKFGGMRTVREAARRAESGIGQLMKESPGFLGYYIFDAGGGVGGSITLFDTQEAATAANEKALAWIQASLTDLIEGELEIVAGEVLRGCYAMRSLRIRGHVQDGFLLSYGPKLSGFIGALPHFSTGYITA